MNKTLKEKILAYNRVRKAQGIKASDLDVLIAALGKLPPGQLKHILTPEILDILEKYDYIGGESNGT